MKISEYIREYTSGEPVTFRQVFWEIKELFWEIFKLNKEGIKEEFEDVFHFFQLWFYWLLGLDGEIWGITKNSVRKFINRKEVWNEIYIYVGLEKNISGYVGNYKKVHKVINHLQKFGISEEKAEESYKKIVLKK